MRFPDRETVERVRRMYPAGCRIVLDHMDDPQSPPVGTQGTVIAVDDTASVCPVWDTGGSLNIIFNEDACHKIRTEEEARTTLEWYGKHQKAEDARCPRCGSFMPGKLHTHALSRRADILICDRCGQMEALEDAGILKTKIPLMEWIAIREPQDGGGKWNP